MEQQPQRKLIKLGLVLFALLVIGLGGWTLYSSITFRIVKINPKPANVTQISPFFNISFSQKLSSKVAVSSVPNIIKNYSVQGKVLSINLIIPLASNQKYVISVDNIYAADGKHLPNQQFVFNPKPVTDNQLPADQKKVLLDAQSQYSQAIFNNKLVQLLPFTGPNFEYKITYTVDYSGATPMPVFIITAPDNQSQQDGLAWINGQGFKTSDLKLQYVTATP